LNVDVMELPRVFRVDVSISTRDLYPFTGRAMRLIPVSDDNAVLEFESEIIVFILAHPCEPSPKHVSPSTEPKSISR